MENVASIHPRNFGVCVWEKVVGQVLWFFRTECNNTAPMQLGHYCPFCAGQVVFEHELAEAC